MKRTCAHCGEELTTGQEVTGVVIHRQIDTLMTVFEPGVAHIECAYQACVGGIGCHLNHQYWCETKHDPNGGRTIRQSALEVTAGRRRWN